MTPARLDAYQISPRCIGDSNFISHVDKLYCEISDKYTSPEDVTFRRVVEPLEAENVLSVIEDVFEIERCELIAENSELRSQVEKCEKRLDELRVTDQMLKA